MDCVEMCRAVASAVKLFRGRTGLVWALVCLNSGWSAGVAHAQLRSGRAQRSLYADQRAEAASREAEVRPASGQRPPSVVQSTSGRRPASSPRASVQTASAVRTAACTDCGDHTPGPLMESYDAGGMAMSSVVDEGYAVESYADGYSAGGGYGLGGMSSAGCGQWGCDQGGCDSCMSDLAPTCSAMAGPPRCGPLMALWCRTSIRGEVPLFWRRSMDAPALVTTSPEGTDADLAGELGRTTTQILLGTGKLSEQLNAGVRLTLTTPLGNEGRYALMFRYWNAGDQDEQFNFSSNQFPILARPFRDTSLATPAANTQLIAFPGDSVGSVSVATTSEVDGLELTLKRLIYMDRFTRVDWLWGYQHVAINESLGISSNTTVTGNIPGLQGNSIAVSDRFATENDFHGVAYGLMSSRQFACWKMETMFRLGMGNLRREVQINGSTTTTANGASLTSSQGLLARNTNSQPFVDDTFVVVPEVGINFACMLRPGLDFNVGYNYLMVPKVGQPGQQIDPNLAVNLSDPLTGPLDPGLNFTERKYGINSLGLGLQLRY